MEAANARRRKCQAAHAAIKEIAARAVDTANGVEKSHLKALQENKD